MRALTAAATRLLLCGVAVAQTDDELAREHYDLAEKLYNRADFKGAAKHFDKSYALSKRPALLHNLAKCYNALGDHEKAVAYYDRYLASDPPQADVIRARVENLRKLIEQKKAEQPGSPAADDPLATDEAMETDEASSSRPLRWSGWVLVGAGGALVATGVVLGVLASSKASDLEAANKAGQPFNPDLEDSGETLNTGAISTLVAGGAAAAVGVVLLILDHRAARRQRQAWITPTLAPGRVALTAGLRF